MDKDYKRSLEVARALRDKATWDNNKEIVKVCEQIIPEIENLAVREGDEVWDETSIGHVFLKHY